MGSNPTPGTLYVLLVILSPLPIDPSLVALFPGQGSISAGAARKWHGHESWSLISEISSIASRDVEELLLEGSDEDLIETDNAQIATFALSLVSWMSWRSANAADAGFALGHSLGEISALVASGIMSLEDGVSLVVSRGNAMRIAADHTPGSMVALMGGSINNLDQLLTCEGLWLANLNGEGQIVVSGTLEAMENIRNVHRNFGWRRATALPVGGAFHSPLMSGAQTSLDDALSKINFQRGRFLVSSNVEGRVLDSDADWRDLLSRQMTAPVRFYDCVNSLPSTVTSTIEMAPGGVLTGLVKRIRDFSSHVITDEVRE